MDEDAPLVIKVYKISLRQPLVFRTVHVVVIMDFYHWSESGKNDLMGHVKFQTENVGIGDTEKVYWIGTIWPH